MSAARPRGRAALDAFCVCLAVTLASSYNIDLEHPVLYRGPRETFFGYSVLEHFHDNTRWILVGAPRANSSFSSSVRSPGAVFKCRIHSNPEQRCTEVDLGRGNKQRESCGKTCQGDRDNEWMGVSLARQDKPNGKVLISTNNSHHSLHSPFLSRTWCRLPMSLHACALVTNRSWESRQTRLRGLLVTDLEMCDSKMLISRVVFKPQPLQDSRLQD
ncbi:hypothetical protein SRHO_G00039230 [Serrasalmus rhombeus]